MDATDSKAVHSVLCKMGCYRRVETTGVGGENRYQGFFVPGRSPLFLLQLPTFPIESNSGRKRSLDPKIDKHQVGKGLAKWGEKAYKSSMGKAD